MRGDPQEFSTAFVVKHSHVHIDGLTIDGLQDPERPDDAESYMDIAIHTIPIDRVYLRDLVFKPAAIGNTRGAMITLSYVEDVEIGEFEVIGPAGVDFLLEEKVGHFGEVVYVGSPIGSRFNAYDLVGHGELGEVDYTNDVHIHHIDASGGHHHIELIDVKAESHDVTVEYCTSVGARLPTDNDNSPAVHLGGTDTTFRWNRSSPGVQRDRRRELRGVRRRHPPSGCTRRGGGERDLRQPDRRRWQPGAELHFRGQRVGPAGRLWERGRHRDGGRTEPDVRRRRPDR
ncbi:MAG: hypothetical protein U5J98_09155 [Halobacteriales archaeon]|nr:hypothetical protein [Halobacteriales archaeon]